jgi:alpha-glucosidase
MLTQRGSVYLYYGEEIGMRNGVVPLDRLRDPVGVRFWPHNPGRDPARTPMQWESGPGAGFTTGEPWLPLGPDYQRLNVAVESRNPHSFLSFYRRLIWQRKTSPALLHGAYRPLEAVPADTYCYLRDAGKERVLVALNFARDKRAVSFERLGSSGAVIASTYANRVGEVPLTGLGLFPLEGLVLRLPPDAPGSSHS